MDSGSMSIRSGLPAQARARTQGVDPGPATVSGADTRCARTPTRPAGQGGDGSPLSSCFAMAFRDLVGFPAAMTSDGPDVAAASRRQVQSPGRFDAQGAVRHDRAQQRLRGPDGSATPPALPRLRAAQSRRHTPTGRPIRPPRLCLPPRGAARRGTAARGRRCAGPRPRTRPRPRRWRPVRSGRLRPSSRRCPPHGGPRPGRCRALPRPG